MTSPAIRTAGLSKQFGTIRALDDLALEIPRGMIFGFLGPNGSGKTTTIRLLLGLLEPTSGGAQVLGYDIRTNAAAIRERTGALLEHCGLYERLSAQDNLDLYGRFWRLGREARQARIKELLTHLDLWDRRHEVVAGWSRGMKQKLAIARALLHRPELVFLDEPTAGLDPIAARALCDDLSRLSTSQGVTVFLTTHNLAEAQRLCALVGVVQNGRLLAVGPPRELVERGGSLEDAFHSLVEVHG
jgi:ABC-2 type transport system ATP-binding protein